MAKSDKNCCGKTVIETTSTTTKYGMAACEPERGTLQYIGARYVPIFADPVEWDNTRTYEHLMMVQNQGNTYISKQAVPVGVDLPTVEGENDFWILMTDWNAQLAEYREEFLAAISNIRTDISLLASSVMKIYPTVQDMVSDENNTDCKFARTLGYYEQGVGGFEYVIMTEIAPFAIELQNGLYAVPMLGRRIYASTLGLGPERTAESNADIIQAVFDISSPSIEFVNDVRNIELNRTINIANAFANIVGSNNESYTNRFTNAVSNVLFNVSAQGVTFENVSIYGNPENINQTAIRALALSSSTGNWYDLDMKITKTTIAYMSTGIEAFGKNLHVVNSQFSTCHNAVWMHSSYNGEETVQCRGWIFEHNIIHGGSYVDRGITDYSLLKNVIYKTDEDATCREIRIEQNRINSNYIGVLYVGTSDNLLIRNNTSETNTGALSIGCIYAVNKDPIAKTIIDGNVLMKTSPGFLTSEYLLTEAMLAIIGNLNEIVFKNNIGRQTSARLIKMINGNVTNLVMQGNVYLFYPSGSFNANELIQYSTTDMPVNVFISGNAFNRGNAQNSINLTNNTVRTYYPTDPLTANSFRTINV